VGILAVMVAGAAWVYFRDLERPRPYAAERALALIDGKRALSYGRARRRCEQCRVTVLDTNGTRRWRLRVEGPMATRCFWVDLDAFQARPTGGFEGLRRAACGQA
jgi:hypothetical protein